MSQKGCVAGAVYTGQACAAQGLAAVGVMGLRNGRAGRAVRGLRVRGGQTRHPPDATRGAHSYPPYIFWCPTRQMAPRAAVAGTGPRPVVPGPWQAVAESAGARWVRCAHPCATRIAPSRDSAPYGTPPRCAHGTSHPATTISLSLSLSRETSRPATRGGDAARAAAAPASGARGT